MDDSDKETRETPSKKKLPLAVSYEVRKRIRELRRQGGGWDPEIGVSMRVFRGPPPGKKNSDS